MDGNSFNCSTVAFLMASIFSKWRIRSICGFLLPDLVCKFAGSNQFFGCGRLLIFT